MFDESDEEKTQCHPLIAHFFKYLFTVVFVLFTFAILAWTFLFKYDKNYIDLVTDFFNPNGQVKNMTSV